MSLVPSKRAVPRSSKIKRARFAGYTLIEVMMGVALSAIGITGITMMQSASVRANQDAYESMVATNFARTWLERVKRDALLWNTAGNPVSSVLFAGRAYPASRYFEPNAGWVPPRPIVRDAAQPQESSGANFHGIEIGSPSDPLAATVRRLDNSDTHYCVHLRFIAVQTNAVGATVAMGVDARAYWMRKGSERTTEITGMRNAIASGCESAPAVYTDPQMLAATHCTTAGGIDNYCLRVHYLRTVVRMAGP